ncbi:hypothetical protein CNR22_18220 [Sphingobacteriaceae bacterium]|nr:hypothetical protein CNR22_18220 [Sphingobacteriaceae bacterium]
MKLVLRNLLTVLYTSLLCIFLSLALNGLSSLVSKNWYLGLSFFALLSIILNFLYSHKAGKEGFTELLLGTVVVKLLFALVFILAYSVIDNPGFYTFSIHFILHYILFTVFEIRYLLHIIKTTPAK